MICAADANTLSALTPENEALLRIVSLFQTYGADVPFCRFWTGEDSVIAVMDGTAIVNAGADYEDVALFLTMSPDIHTVRTDDKTAKHLAKLWDTTAKIGVVMRADCAILPTGESADLPLSQLYPLLATVFSEGVPPFDVWYADVHHRFRHGLFYAAAAVRGGKPASCALTTAACDTDVLLGGVATLPQFRGQGLASLCVTALAHARQTAGQRVWISPKNDAAERLYQKLGFTVCGQWGMVHKS